MKIKDFFSTVYIIMFRIWVLTKENFMAKMSYSKQMIDIKNQLTKLWKKLKF